MLVDDRGIIGYADHDESGTMGQILVIGTHGMLDAMFSSTSRCHHAIAGKRIGKCHTAASLHVSAILECNG